MRTPARAAAALLLLCAVAFAEEPPPPKPAAVPSPTGVDVERLRRAAPFPTIPLRIGMSIDKEDVTRWMGASPPSRESQSKEQDALTARLKEEPGDMEAWLRLGHIRESLEDEPGAREAFRSAVSLSEGDEAPDVRDGERLRRRADAVRGSYDPNDVAPIVKRVLPLLERACALAPDSAACHAELARAQGGAAMCRLLPRDSPPPEGPFSVETLLAGRPSSSAVAESLELMGSALRAMERARELKPTEQEYAFGVYELRHLWMSLAQRCRPPHVVMDAFAGFADDLRRLHAVRPDAVELLTIAVFYDSAVAMAASDGQKGKEDAKDRRPIDSLPEARRKRLESDVAALEKAAESSQGARRALLLRPVATFYARLRADPASAETVARRATKAEPENDLNWNLILFSTEDPTSDMERALAIAEERLRSGESTLFRLLAAKCHFNGGSLEASEKHVRAALKTDPANYRAVMALAALQLRGGGPGSTLEAVKTLDPLMDASKDFEEDDLACFLTLGGVIAGVEGRMKEADQFLGIVRKRFPKYEAAEEALRALGKSPDEPVK
jgi:hypothetical protein